MKNQVHLSGLIIKHEELIPLHLKNLQISISEANNPYANYYGSVPRKAVPNSLFLFTNRFYYLEEIISYAKQIEKCLFEKINIASAVIQWNGKQFNAIRIKNFPEYEQLSTLQSCLADQGVEFVQKLPVEGLVLAKISKLFKLNEPEDSFYIDLLEENKGYFTHEKRVSDAEFSRIMTQVKHNGNCHIFDAVRGEIIVDGQIHEIVRIFAEGLNLQLLKCIKKEFDKLR